MINEDMVLVFLFEKYVIRKDLGCFLRCRDFKWISWFGEKILLKVGRDFFCLFFVDYFLIIFFCLVLCLGE